MRSPGRLSGVGLVALAVAALLTTPLAAHAAYSYRLGGAAGFNGSFVNAAAVRVNGADVIRLQRRIVWQFTPKLPFDPRTATRLANGNTLVSDGNAQSVTEYNPAGSAVWSYTSREDASLSRPFSAERLANGNTLICDRTSFRVIEVNAAKHIVWRFGTGASGIGAGQLADPFSARRLSNGNTLICDNKDGYRVIEVRSTDYSPSKANLGYTAASIVWRYGTGVSATGPGQVASPRQAERLGNGNTLISDEWGNRVIEVDRSGKVVWSFGVAGEKGLDDTHLYAPCAATRLADGRTLIVDKDNRRLLWVGKDGAVDGSYGLGPETPSGGELKEPRTAQVTPSGNVLIADNGAQRLLEIGYVPKGTYVTQNLDLGMPGIRKWLTATTVTADTPSSTSVAVSYSLDGGSWKSLGSGSALSFPSPTRCRFARLRFTLSTTNADRSPSWRSSSIAYDVTAPAPKPSGGGGTTPPPSAQGTGNQSGTSSGSQRVFTWGWGSADGGGTGGAGGASAGTGSGTSTTGGTPSVGDLSFSDTAATTGRQLSGWLLKEIAPGPVENAGGTDTASSDGGGSTAEGAGAIGADAAAEITERTGPLARAFVLLTLCLAYAAGTLSGTLRAGPRRVAESHP